MAVLTWDNVGQRFYETGVDRGVLYIPDNFGVYNDGVAWNGLTSVTESPSGAEPNAMYADNIKYLNLFSVEEFSATLEAYTYPDEFALFDGFVSPSAGVTIGQQTRGVFGLSYRTRLGNDVDQDDYGYKLHLIYGCKASPSERNYATINDSPEAISFSWEISTTPVASTGNKPTSIITIDSTKVLPANLVTLENLLYGTAGSEPSLPLPDDVVAIFAGGQTAVTTQNPTFVSATGVITIPSVTGVTYRRADTNAIVTGTVTISGGAGANLVITAAPTNSTYVFTPQSDTDWSFTRTA
jgi:hypothetical protein